MGGVETGEVKKQEKVAKAKARSSLKAGIAKSGRWEGLALDGQGQGWRLLQVWFLKEH